jgi:mediator of RNA polymerase II transcription subunit 11
MAASNSNDRLQQLEIIEQQIALALQFAGQGLAEMSKDTKTVIRQVETQTGQFMKTMENIETGLLKQINYLSTVSTGQPHEGSSYAAQKDMQMAYHRLEHVKSRIAELERLRLEQQQQQRSGGGVAAADASSSSTSLSAMDTST